jgi:hypothetical protein
MAHPVFPHMLPKRFINFSSNHFGELEKSIPKGLANFQPGVARLRATLGSGHPPNGLFPERDVHLSGLGIEYPFQGKRKEGRGIPVTQGSAKTRNPGLKIRKLLRSI